LLLDRLDETLTHRIIKWRQEQDATTSLATSPRNDGDDHANIYRYAEKLNLALHLAPALENLHDNRIVLS
jgi:hypothetical protein